MINLQGYRGIVTGASSGIGLAISKFLSECGATVFCISRTGKPKNDEEAIPQGVAHLKGDICDNEEMRQIITKIGDDGGIDFLVNNAGITIKRRAELLQPEEFAKVQAVNVCAPFNLSLLCFPYLSASKHTGRIINISSMAAHLGFSEVVPYSASKSGIVGLTKGLAVEWAKNNVTVNSIAPGWFPTEMTKQVMDDERKQRILSRMPMHAFGNASDLGAMAAFLLSEHATYITGVDYAVDGGALAYGF
ncbi:SDR family oxidoreductase [uncultured Sphaerochaeta sp.]|uniref:SDR family NAD(P)-dependent oxidoreductase n=1 Tax=uncultured Sphaerochaeta sp. TaxID=886478 RepID=UPI002AA82655|nr:SDR family oxidoreductase [uncultured Sphaerochaeta sp.]